MTGSNLRNILLLTDKLHVEDLEPSLVDNIMYHKIEEKTWEGRHGQGAVGYEAW